MMSRSACLNLTEAFRPLPELKLVLDTPISSQEKPKVTKFISIHIEEQYAAYKFEAKQEHRGGERVPEKVTVTFFVMKQGTKMRP